VLTFLPPAITETTGLGDLGKFVKEHRQACDLTRAELARHVACATIPIRKIEVIALLALPQHIQVSVLRELPTAVRRQAVWRLPTPTQ